VNVNSDRAALARSARSSCALWLSSRCLGGAECHCLLTARDQSGAQSTAGTVTPWQRPVPAVPPKGAAR
jgi:hypothetical protein